MRLKILFILVVLAWFVGRACGIDSSVTVGAGFTQNIIRGGHTYTYLYGSIPNSTVVWIKCESRTNGGAWSTVTTGDWMQRDAAGVGTKNITIIGTGADQQYAGWDYGNNNVTSIVERRWVKRDAPNQGMVLGYVRDKVTWTYNPSLTSNSGTAQHPIDNITINGSGDGCSTPRTGLSFFLASTVHPPISGGYVTGSYVYSLYVNDILVGTSPPFTDLGMNIPGPATHNVSFSGIATEVSQFSYAWKLNGVTIASGGKACDEEVVGNNIYTVASSTQTSPTTTTTETPPGGGTTTTTTTQTPGNPGNPDQPPSTTTTTTTTLPTDPTPTFVSQQEIYAAVYQALLDAGKTGGGGLSGGQGVVLEDLTLEDDGGADEVLTKAQELKSQQEEALNAMSGKLYGFTFNLPTSFGTVSTVDFGTIPVLNTPFVVSLNSGPIGSKVSLIRTAILWVITVVFIVGSIRALRYYL